MEDGPLTEEEMAALRNQESSVSQVVAVMIALGILALFVLGVYSLISNMASVAIANLTGFERFLLYYNPQ